MTFSVYLHKGSLHQHYSNKQGASCSGVSPHYTEVAIRGYLEYINREQVAVVNFPIDTLRKVAVTENREIGEG